MGFSKGQEIIDFLRGKKSYINVSKVDKHKIYKKIYYPIYNLNLEIIEGDSHLYNEYGEKIEEFFLRDINLGNYPYRISRYFNFDRYNFGLKTHFYGHKAIFERFGNPERQYAYIAESEGLIKHLYDKVLKNEKYMKDFDLIFTYSARLLDKYENARFVPFCAPLWNTDMSKLWNLNLNDNQWQEKTKNISIVSSNKLMCDLHKFRFDLAQKCKREGLADTFGTFDGGRIVFADTFLDPYRYSICIENYVSPYFFTERLISAFASQTIPIYLGATEIDKFFNPDGIIKITTKSDIEKVLKQCTKEEYERRLPAILDNYKRCLEYQNPWDYMYEKYLNK